jgi:hypothetical protein
MDLKKRILIAVALLLVIVAIVVGVDALQRRSAASAAPTDMPPGSVPIFLDGRFAASFVPGVLEQLKTASFVDAEDGRPQDGWLLRDVLLLYLGEDNLQPASQITVSSSSRGKSHTLAWSDVEKKDNMVMFDVSNRGTLKLVSKMPGFDVRDTWVQDVDKIEIVSP